MSRYIDGLENRIDHGNSQKYKSRGERKIAYFLDQCAIRYRYEPAVLVHSNGGKQRIWYPDFYLTEFKTYIEYFGMVGDQQYDKGTRVKQSIYKKDGIDAISIYPWMFKENWQGYIMQQLERKTLERYRKLMEKPYWSAWGHGAVSNSKGINSFYGNIRKRSY
jgi:hypothetical protein